MELPVYKKRYGDEVVGLTEFITPQTPKVWDVLRNEIIVPDDENVVWYIWNWCCTQIKYPPFMTGHEDYHKQQKFLTEWPIAVATLKRSVNEHDFWQFPFETLDPPRYGDCDDKSFTFTSLVLNFLEHGSVFCCIGRIFGLGHCWVEFKEGDDYYILDPVLPHACSAGLYCQPSAAPYEVLIRFDDLTVYDTLPGYEFYLNIPVSSAKVDYKSKYDMLIDYYKGRL